jgi:hypothetical protein
MLLLRPYAILIVLSDALVPMTLNLNESCHAKKRELILDGCLV